MAIRAPDPHNLRNAAQSTGVIEGDRECPACGYNLRGLRFGVACPECGMPVTGPRAGEVDDPLSLAPTPVILAFIRGCWAASIIIALAVALSLAPRFPDWPAARTIWAMCPLSVLWVGAVAWLTPAFGIPQAATRGFNRRGRLRHAARLLQWGWVLAAGLQLLEFKVRMSIPSHNLAQVGNAIGLLAGLTGVVLLAILLERLANWARDDGAEKLFNWATWFIPLTSVMLVFGIPLLPPALFGGGGPVVTVAWLLAIGLFPYAMLSLSGSVTLSVVHAYEHRQREQRRADRQRTRDEQLARTVQTMDAERARRGHV